MTEKIHLKWPACGAFEIKLGDVNVAIDPYLFGEALEAAEPIFDYIFISHEHFDHCHPKTLKKLCTGDRFKKLYVNIGCLTPAEPVDEKYGDAGFARDLPITQHIPSEMVQVIYPKYGEDDDREWPGPCEVDLGPISVEAVESGEQTRPDLVTCGYLITHKEKGVSFYHTGDLHKSFPAMENLRGRVDFLIHMKTYDSEPAEFTRWLEVIKPRCVIPTHYRTDRESEPVPVGHWPPNLTDVNAYLEHLREYLPEGVRLLPFTAGVEYEVELPGLQVKWDWEWYRSWTVPLWREES